MTVEILKVYFPVNKWCEPRYHGKLGLLDRFSRASLETIIRPTQVDFGIRATPPPSRFWAISDESCRVFRFWVILYCEGSFCPYDLDRLADSTRHPPRRKSTQNIARIPKSTSVGLRQKALSSSFSTALCCSHPTTLEFGDPPFEWGCHGGVTAPMQYLSD